MFSQAMYIWTDGTEPTNVLRSKMKIIHKNTSSAGQRADNVDESYLNKLLDKISKSGYDSLTSKEKDDLFKLSQKK